MATSGDANTLFEVYPERTTLNIPDADDQAVFAENPGAPLAAWGRPSITKVCSAACSPGTRTVNPNFSCRS
jgi:hypothetical protein